MRRNQTLQPHAWYRTATRKRGYGSRVLYLPVTRPKMTGIFYWLIDPFNENWFCLTKDGITWWLTSDFSSGTFGVWNDFIASGPHYGDYWNNGELGRSRKDGIARVSTWAEVNNLASFWTGPFGPTPWTISAFVIA